jgi:hypothetical protein
MRRGLSACQAICRNGEDRAQKLSSNERRDVAQVDSRKRVGKSSRERYGWICEGS